MPNNNPEGENQHTKSSTGGSKTSGETGQKSGGSKSGSGSKSSSGGKSGSGGAKAK